MDVATLLAEPGGHPYVAKMKASLAKKASLTRMEPLYEAVDLAWYQVALGRDRDAQPLLDWIVAGVAFTGNYNLWSPVGAAICLRARIARLDGDDTLRKALIQRLVQHPAYATVDRNSIDNTLADDVADVDTATADKSQKWACHRLSRALMGLSYFRETAGAGFYYDKWIDVAALDGQIERALGLLRERLG